MSMVNNTVTAGKFFLIIAGELILIFIAVAFIVGLLLEYLPPSRIRGFFAGRLTWVQYVLGAGLGAITPFCSCSTVPILTGLLRGGVPFGPAMAFLFASPVLNPVIIGLFLALLGWQVTAVYFVVTFFGTLLTAAVLSKLGLERDLKPLAVFEDACCDSNAESDPKVQDVQVKARMGRAMASAVDTFKGVFWYLMLGAGIGAFIYGFFPQDLVVRVAGPGNRWSIPFAAALGVPMYIRAETIIPIGAALIGKGMGVGTVLALVIGGAGASIPEVIILNSIFKQRMVIAFVVAVFVVAVAAGYLVDAMGIVSNVA